MGIFSNKTEPVSLELAARVADLERRLGEVESAQRRITAEWVDTFDQFNRLASRISRDLNRARPTVVQTPDVFAGVSQGGQQEELPLDVPPDPVPNGAAPPTPAAPLETSVDRMELLTRISQPPRR